MRLAAALLLLLLPAAAAASERRDTAVFDFYVKGFHVGTLTFAGVQSGAAYAVNGRFATAGLAALVRRIRYDATVQGHLTADGLRPDRYQLTTTRPGRPAKVETLAWAGATPSRAGAPAGPAGSVDDLTAIYATLRAIPPAEACQARIAIYDGERRARLTLWPDTGKGPLACGGEYRRVAGYSASDMAHPAFPFRMTYAAAPGGLVEVDAVTMDSIYGAATLKRR